MHKRNKTATFNFLQVALDALTIASAYAVASLAYAVYSGGTSSLPYLWMPIQFALVFLLTMFVVRMYNLTTFFYLDRVLIRTIGACTLSAFTLSVVIFLAQLKETSRFFYLTFLLVCSLLLVAQRVVSRKATRWLVKDATRTIFIGDEVDYRRYKHFMEQTMMRNKFISHHPFTDPRIADSEGFEKYIISHHIDEVVMVQNQKCQFPYEDCMYICEDMGITVRLVMDIINLPLSERYISSIGTYPVVTYHSVSMDRVQLFFKSVFDIVGASVGLLLLSPIMALAALAIKLESPGPVFFRQKRIGLNGREFEIWKFRSMYQDAEARKKELMAKNKIKGGMMFKMDNDPRVTKVGNFIRKTSIDELPQLFNVLRREMSLVGTRPPTPDEVGLYKRNHRRRISIRPGITGMWQVSGRSDVLDFEKVVELDTQYIDEWSLALDLKLLVRTAGVVLSQKGSY